ncbi:MAG: hypothetical protein ACRCSQ_05690 [Bacteroidales bacterium]
MIYQIFMNTIASIDDLIFTNESITQKRKNPVLYIIFFLLGVSTLFIAYSPDLMDHNNLITGLWVLGLSLITTGIIGISIPKKAFYYKPTGEMLRRKELYFNTKDKTKVLSALQQGDLTDLPPQIENCKAAMMVVLYCTSKNSCLMAQPMEYMPFQFVATQEPVIHYR